jgi:type IV pilus assembly protein PilO
MAMDLSLDTILALDRTKKILILAGVLVLLTALYVWALFLPAHKKIGELDSKLSELLDKKAENEAIVQDLAAFKREYHQLELSLTQAMAQLPDKKEIPSLLENISNLGRESGLDVSLFKPGAQKPKGFYAEVPVDIKLVGTFHNLLTFFYRVGNLHRIVNISDLSINRSKAGASASSLDTACKATTYKFLEESERPKPAQDGQPAKGRNRKSRRSQTK